MINVPSVDRRQANRLRVRMRVDYLVLGRQRVFDMGLLQDLGARGCSLVVANEIPWRELEFTIYLPGGNKASCRGEVGWTADLGLERGKRLVGVRFTGIDADGRKAIERFVDVSKEVGREDPGRSGSKRLSDVSSPWVKIVKYCVETERFAAGMRVFRRKRTGLSGPALVRLCGMYEAAGKVNEAVEILAEAVAVFESQGWVSQAAAAARRLAKLQAAGMRLEHEVQYLDNVRRDVWIREGDLLGPDASALALSSVQLPAGDPVCEVCGGRGWQFRAKGHSWSRKHMALGRWVCESCAGAFMGF